MEIRTFDEADRTELRELFGRAGEGSPTASLWGHLDSEAAIYLDPYLEHDPDSVFVAIVDGAMVGYLTGCLDSSTFPSESARMDQAIRQHRLMFRAGPARFFLRALVDVASAKLRHEPATEDFADARWPAHLHINVARSARGTGAADELMRGWQERLRDKGSPGCHLQTLVENVRAVRFFERMGFTPYGPTPSVPGLRYERRRVHQQTMVWNPDA